ncbi:MAG: DNA topoisomerase (ATP-hydrolyzing) subunit B [Chloroflexota bacterium]|nr:DNA topoisomerase (ATP-hydrolyzing) subunit B [Chloroflexota bacterium]MDE2930587.1 DNA topoisomerase (ATP-hydrolyzing) subunit B [Chloroflexota bacterium]
MAKKTMEDGGGTATIVVEPEPTAADLNDYTAADIQVLEGLEPVRTRPGMFIGSTDVRGLHHLVYEVVDNSVDEALAGLCDRILITIHADCSVTIEDNGRGIPVDVHEKTGVSALETVLTRLHAGGKFGGKSYKVSGGLHGVGVSIVNALSTKLVATVYQAPYVYRQEYRNGAPLGQVERMGKTDRNGTTIHFLPDSEIMETLDYEFNTLAQRFREVAYLCPALRIEFRDERTARELTFYFESGIRAFVHQMNRRKTVINNEEIFFAGAADSLQLEAALQYTQSFDERIYAFANTINNVDGGTHLTGFRSALTRTLNDYARKQNLIKEKDLSLTGDDVRTGLTAVISVRLTNPQFEGQTKAKLGNSEVRGFVEATVNEKLGQYLEEHPSEGKAIIEKCLNAARARIAAQKARDMVARKGYLDVSTLPGKLADCSERSMENAEIFIVEGDSAGGNAKQGRERRFQAILPLRGKILNAERTNLDRMLSNAEIRALVTALGTSIGETFDIAKLRYGKIIIMTDADVDGAHIRTLLLTFFFRYMREIITNQRLYIAQAPLYRVARNRDVHYAWDDDERDRILKQFSRANAAIQRYKGLGEMNADQLWETTMDPARRKLLQVMLEDQAAVSLVFDQLMGDDPQARKRFIQAHAKEVQHLDV